MSFYAFLDDMIFQGSDGNHLKSDTNTIPKGVKVFSSVLSASIVGEPMSKLKENVTIVFQVDRVVTYKWLRTKSSMSVANTTLIYKQVGTTRTNCYRKQSEKSLSKNC